jgi:hypothetical protein
MLKALSKCDPKVGELSWLVRVVVWGAVYRLSQTRDCALDVYKVAKVLKTCI